MNKYQEALEYFVLWLNPSAEEFDYDNYLKHRNALKELVNKEKPMKPVRKGKLNSLYCPKCDKPLMFQNTICCDKCGQKLDWSDTND